MNLKSQILCVSNQHLAQQSFFFSLYIPFTLHPSPFTLHPSREREPPMGKSKTGSHTPPRLKLRLRLRTPSFRQGALRHVMTRRCSANPGGGRAKRVALMKVLERSSARSLSISKKLFVVARQFVFSHHPSLWRAEAR